ncbi:MAG: esterase-like activity of phytase family protein [Sphingobium sp.]
MERAVLILILFVLLLNGRHPEFRPPSWSANVKVSATPLALFPDQPERRQLGELTYIGGWALHSGKVRFGSISSMTVDGTGRVTALSDGGEVMVFRPGPKHFRAHVYPVAIFPAEEHGPQWRWDTESMAVDPASGRIWVGFEAVMRICRYSMAFARVEQCASPPAAREWPMRTGMESLVRLPDGRFLAIAEDSPGPKGGHDVLLFAGDPVDPATPPPARLSYMAPAGYLPTDAIAIGGGRMLVMNRRLTLADMFTGVLTMVDIRDLRPGAVLKSREVARLASPVPHDNFEALAMSHENGRPVLWIASDDNGLFFQRTLVLKFAMPPDWFRPVAAH